jgi:hypothetical protein
MNDNRNQITPKMPDNPMDARIGTLRAQGASIRDISASVGLSINAVHHRVHKPDLKKFIQNLSERLARQTGEILLENHRLALEAANKAWQEIARQETPEDAARMTSTAKDLLQLADAKEKRIGQSLGVFASHAPSFFLQQVFVGPTAVVISDNLAAMIGTIQRQLPITDDQDEGDIIDLD